ncbi:beta-glucosidase [uncultured Erythrobacter sp.]|uniref:beta-glucosidase family protein n=1 Tax=uncultured Erythrobacter sp. TaxID=263913 RepID=UPI0026050439|nr:glycoside hydrolase family 3 C-terminal domain-containing protein [uncultured Erythrobacter sp.]
MAHNTPDVSQLIAQLSLTEKVRMLSGDLEFWDGMQQLTREDYYHKHAFPVAANERLRIPGLNFIDGPRGVVVFGGATMFPVTMARGATWNPELEAEIGDALGRELRLLGGNLTGAVCINLLRHPAWGRAQETYGEDTHHLGVMGAALTRGIQRHAIACVKHYALNSMENARFQVDVTIDDRSLHEVYLPHFKACVDAGAQCFMSAYNSVNGEWAGQNKVLLDDILRERWGFDGFVITDFIFGVRDGEKAIEAGLDLEMPFPMVWGKYLEAMVTDGRVDEALLDRALERAIAPQFELPPIDEYDPDDLGCEKHKALAREAAVQSITLLKNDDAILPLRPHTRVVMLGDLAARSTLGDRGSSDGRPDHAVHPHEGMQAAAKSDVTQYDTLDSAEADQAVRDAEAVLVVVGNTYREEGEYIAPLSNLAKLSENFPPPPKLHWLFGKRFMRPVWTRIVKAVLGFASRSQRKQLDTEQGSFGRGGDRVSLRLKPEHAELIKQAAKLNPNVIVALVGGSAIVMEEWKAHAKGIMMLWYPGQEGGHALADIVYGVCNPSGRLPFSIPADEAHLPFFDKDATAITYDLWHGYRKLQRDKETPAFPFGFGLSYTEFFIENLVSDKTTYDLEGTAKLTVEVANVGERDGECVVQIYTSAIGSSVVRAPRELSAFARVPLKAGEKRHVEIAFPIKKLAFFDTAIDDFRVEPGTYILTAAQHVDDDGQELILEVGATQ